MKNFIKLFIITISIIIISTACISGQKAVDSQKLNGKLENELTIYTSFYPVYFLTSEIVGDMGEVKNITPAGAEPHDWEPTPKTIAELQNSDMFVYNGIGMEAWVDKVASILSESNIKIVCSTENIELLENNEHQHESRDSHASHGEYDPHVWVSPIKAKQQAQNILTALIQLDPVNKVYYTNNYNTLSDKLSKLDSDIKKCVKSFKNNTIVTSHDAFGYFAHDYGLIQIPIRGVNPEEEPSPAKMAELVKLCREYKVKYIFVEKLVSPKLSEALANEVGAGILILNAGHGLDEEEINSGKNYIDIMYENLENLKKALME